MPQVEGSLPPISEAIRQKAQLGHSNTMSGQSKSVGRARINRDFFKLSRHETVDYEQSDQIIKRLYDRKIMKIGAKNQKPLPLSASKHQSMASMDKSEDPSLRTAPSLKMRPLGMTSGIDTNGDYDLNTQQRFGKILNKYPSYKPKQKIVVGEKQTERIEEVKKIK